MATVVSTASITFGDDTYAVKSMPGGKSQTCEAVDVTTLSDSKKQFAPGALTVNGEISVTIAGNNPPALNTADALSFTVGGDTVTCGSAVCRSLTPATLEADNSRELTWEAVFQVLG